MQSFCCPLFVFCFVCRYIGVILMIVAIIAIFVRVGPMTADYLAGTYSGGAHEIIGILSFALTLAQPVFAFCRNGCCETDKEKKDKCHNAWHIIHMICGYGALVLALTAVGLGIMEYRLVPDWPALFIAGYVIAIGSLIVCVIAGLVVLVLRFKCKMKNTEGTPATSKVGGTDPESQKSQGSGNNNNNNAPPGSQILAWVLFVLLLVGAVLCAVAVGLDDSRG